MCVCEVLKKRGESEGVREGGSVGGKKRRKRHQQRDHTSPPALIN